MMSQLFSSLQTGQPPEFWTTLSSNILVLLMGGALTVISYLAFRRERDRSFQIAALGFLFLVLGNITLMIYQIFVNRSYFLGGRELLGIQTIQGVLIALGFLFLLYSLYRT